MENKSEKMQKSSFLQNQSQEGHYDTEKQLQFLTHLEFQMRFDLLFEITSYLLRIFQGNKTQKYICNPSDGQIRIFLI